MKGKGLGFVIGGAIGMLMSLVWLIFGMILGGVFVGKCALNSEKGKEYLKNAKKEEA